MLFNITNSSVYILLGYYELLTHRQLTMVNEKLHLNLKYFFDKQDVL